MRNLEIVLYRRKDDVKTRLCSPFHSAVMDFCDKSNGNVLRLLGTRDVLDDEYP